MKDKTNLFNGTINDFLNKMTTESEKHLPEYIAEYFVDKYLIPVNVNSDFSEGKVFNNKNLEYVISKYMNTENNLTVTNESIKDIDQLTKDLSKDDIERFVTLLEYLNEYTENNKDVKLELKLKHGVVKVKKDSAQLLPFVSISVKSDYTEGKKVYEGSITDFLNNLDGKSKNNLLSQAINLFKPAPNKSRDTLNEEFAQLLINQFIEPERKNIEGQKEKRTELSELDAYT